ncbi:hypothetical protein [Rhizobium leguminosarum]|uniref:hypothetical protein n=1 Tax=Rhizobium leguminosarum TaxID=384 RepID=UPI003529C29A
MASKGAAVSAQVWISSALRGRSQMFVTTAQWFGINKMNLMAGTGQIPVNASVAGAGRPFN